MSRSFGNFGVDPTVFDPAYIAAHEEEEGDGSGTGGQADSAAQDQVCQVWPCTRKRRAMRGAALPWHWRQLAWAVATNQLDSSG